MTTSMKNIAIFILIALLCTSLKAQTFEKDNFIFHINADGTASWCGMKKLGNKQGDFCWKEGSVPIINVEGRKEDVKYAYRKFKKEIKIPDHVKYNGTKYVVASIDVDSCYFFRPLDEQRMRGPMPWLCQMSILIPPTITDIPERMWALHYEGLEVKFKKWPEYYAETNHCMMDTRTGRVVAIDFYSMPLDRYISREVSLPKTACSLSPYAMRGHIISSVEWSESISEIEPETFKNCIFLNDVTIPGHINVICTSAFERACGLGTLKIEDGVKKIEERAFYNCMVTKVEMPNSCTEIGREAFARCNILKEIKLSESLSKITQKTFAYTYALDSISVPKGVSIIEDSAFFESRILRVSLPDSLSTISPSTFQRCKALVAVHLPDNLQCIRDRAFMECINLAFLELPSSCKRLDKNVFSGSGLQLLVVNTTNLELSDESLGDASQLKYVAFKEVVNVEEASPVITAILKYHPTVFVHLRQPVKQFRDAIKDITLGARIRNGEFRPKYEFREFDFVNESEVRRIGSSISTQITKTIQGASTLCWCYNEQWESFHTYVGFTLDEDGRPVLTVKGDSQKLMYHIKAIEHQLCGIGGYIINSGGHTYQPKAIFENGIMETF